MQPLAERMRPTKLQDLIGQEHLTGNGKVLNTAMVTKHIPSMIFWGPPGVGKTSLAKIIAQDLERPFHILSAVQSGVKEVREVLEKAKNQRFFDQASPILFIDEIHRFNKTQQDALLAAVEHGTILLIGATTENPSFEVNAALLSRCHVYVLKPLQKEALLKLTNQILAKDFLFQNKKITLDETEGLIQLANGDARKLCNIMELIGSQNSDEIHITDALVFQLVQENPAIYDKNGEMHYDMASAFIKSIRGSDPNATLYWMARMIDGGEDPSFIVRRMFISAAEDIGLANPNALLMVSACQNAVQMVGWPESRIILSEAAIYLACSPKSNSAYTAIEKALEQTKKSGNQAVPLHLRNAVTGLMKNMDYGKDYQYAHEHEHSFVDLEYLPEALRAQKFYEPGKNQSEDKIRAILKQFWKEKYNY
ncbi:MAG: replication-associated recombination protein A [Saprospiraceae bacterium]|nr:replication-associated recombination protein A [Saprospiraceae bacterium]